MLLDPHERIVVSSLGWVDGGTIWCLDLHTMRPRSLRVGRARYLDLLRGADGYFAAVHRFDGGRVEISVHSFDQPAERVAQALIEGTRFTVEGPDSVWASIPRVFVAYLEQPGWSDYGLVRIDPIAGISVQPFEWYNDDDYDKGYQGVFGATEIPGGSLVIVSVQRSSTLVLHDPIQRQKAGEIKLSAHSGNPALRFRADKSELWASDYNTVIKLDPATWRVLGRRPLQRPADGVEQFIGELGFARDEQICTVARPFSGDVVAISSRNMRPRYRARVGGQPLEAAALADGKVVARDWKSGDLLTGKLRRTWRL